MTRKSWRRWTWIGTLALVVGISLGIIPAYAAAPFPRATLLPQSDAWTCMQVTSGVSLNVRAGPGTQYGVLAVLTEGVQVDAATRHTLQTDDYTWVPIRTRGGLGGWAIAQRFVPCSGTTQTATAEATTESVRPWTDAGNAGVNVLDAVNQDGELDHDEIAAIARAVVSLEIEDYRGDWYGGTGTLIAPNGIIVTNAHVVEDARTITVNVLEDINAQPVPRYQGTVLLQDDRLDVAVVGINADRYGNAIAPSSLALPYLPLQSTPTEMYRGDEIYIFGYPGIGDAYLVLTRGGIVSVEGGTLAGAQIPLWYRTDAEIAPGNSGGLAVNGNGEFVGIPTFVESEEETGGRLGGIRAAAVVLYVLDEAGFGTLLAPVSAEPARATVGAAPVRVNARVPRDRATDRLKAPSIPRTPHADALRSPQGRSAYVSHR